jgi:hypothetical protein
LPILGSVNVGYHILAATEENIQKTIASDTIQYHNSHHFTSLLPQVTYINILNRASTTQLQQI